ncbi:MAG TPA: Holliday junction branch migration protein RuvA [Pseudomonadales bacterium]|jgi:Holliday junction DNA helicase RuvA|nr:Holliday junction branch migration protein RuvA [Pseudomonadales bacterium]
MIGRIRGKLISLDEHTVLVDVAGIGYELDVTANTLSKLPGVGHDVVLFTHLSVREDAHSLYGFESHGERDLFRILIKISGVGPKLALNLLSGMDVVDLARCIRDSDIARLVKLPGVGRKTAERLVVELKDRIERLVLIPDVTRPKVADATRHVIEEAERALIKLGYRPAEASRAVGNAYVQGQSTEDVVRIALKRMIGQEA